MDEADIGMLDDNDRKILSASILGVDITEFTLRRESPEWPRSSVLFQVRRWI